MPDSQLASIIDHTCLRADASSDDIRKLCDEAITYGFKTVCVSLANLPLAVKLLEGQKTYPITVIDFPLGEGSLQDKVDETKKAISIGAKEIDMVMNYKALKKKGYKQVLEEIKAVVTAAGCPVKVIIEACFLNHDEKVAACVLAKAAGAHFVKTSTGFGSGGATVEDVALMRSVVGDDMGVKASGGIRSYQDAMNLKRAGANRLGLSASVKVIEI